MSGPSPTQTPADVASDYAATAFVFQQMLSQQATAALVRVVACTNSGGLSAWGTVDVQPLVNMVNPADGTNEPHGVIYRLPYSRLQGGVNAVILDPVKNDIGLAVFTMRDSSAVKANPVQAVANANAGKGTPPGSFRQYSMADGMYFGGFLNGVPVQYVEFLAAGAGIKVVSPTAVTVKAPAITLDGAVHVTGAVTGDSTAVFTGDVTGSGTSLHTHTHAPGTYVAGATPVTGHSGNPL